MVNRAIKQVFQITTHHKREYRIMKSSAMILIICLLTIPFLLFSQDPERPEGTQTIYAVKELGISIL